MIIKSYEDAEKAIEAIATERGLSLKKSGELDLENFILFLQGQGFCVKVERIDASLERERQKALSYLKHSFSPEDKRYLRQQNYKKYLQGKGIVNPLAWPGDCLPPIQTEEKHILEKHFPK